MKNKLKNFWTKVANYLNPKEVTDKESSPVMSIKIPHNTGRVTVVMYGAGGSGGVVPSSQSGVFNNGLMLSDGGGAGDGGASYVTIVYKDPEDLIVRKLTWDNGL
jgi:hypothetical protein